MPDNWQELNIIVRVTIGGSVTYRTFVFNIQRENAVSSEVQGYHSGYHNSSSVYGGCLISIDSRKTLNLNNVAINGSDKMSETGTLLRCYYK